MKGKITGDVSLNNVPRAGVDVSFKANTSGVSFIPNPTITDVNGDYVTSVVFPPQKSSVATRITASVTVDGQNVQSVGVAEVLCLLFDLYVTNADSNNISVIDSDTNTVISTLTGFLGPTGIGANPSTNLVYPYNRDLNLLSVIDATTNLIINTITAGEQVVALELLLIQ
ncbi:hypothetical protein LC087_15395 [Bacillus carboniphilus]|uniref:Uncharacterized protein n=1 Tax=Bacillus carboniphilus TaxID=86663 RepID=A0ABY9JRU9_9BACI|nr:hypothetical protein [Bacillus carboniphilus]WLR42130.1 hypothetical protein LC087_15395 [Bacillus carboniphilus]